MFKIICAEKVKNSSVKTRTNSVVGHDISSQVLMRSEVCETEATPCFCLVTISQLSSSRVITGKRIISCCQTCVRPSLDQQILLSSHHNLTHNHNTTMFGVNHNNILSSELNILHEIFPILQLTCLLGQARLIFVKLFVVSLVKFGAKYNQKLCSPLPYH